MPVPENDVVCRFVRKDDWSTRENRPRTGAFKKGCISVWHKVRLQQNHFSLGDLCIGSLAGAGQAHHTVADYKRIASEVAEIEGEPFAVLVEWRQEDEFVAEEWRRWRYAHAQVEPIDGSLDSPLEFRRQLALQTRFKAPPP